MHLLPTYSSDPQVFITPIHLPLPPLQQAFELFGRDSDCAENQRKQVSYPLKILQNYQQTHIQDKTQLLASQEAQRALQPGLRLPFINH